MAVSLTEAQVRDRTKTVTRRAGWRMLRAGDQLILCRKVMGRRRGEPLDRIAAGDAAVGAAEEAHELGGRPTAGILRRRRRPR